MTVDFITGLDVAELPGEGTIHVFTVAHDATDRWWSLLTAEEEARARRFRMPKPQSQFVQSRGVLRLLLGRYLRTDPLAVRIMLMDSGKPFIHSGCKLEFNVSHTDGLTLLAFGRRRLGIDVERIRPMPTARDLAERFFAPEEIRQLAGVGPHRQDDHFFRIWTRKEAILKATARGIPALECCEVTFLDGDPPRIARLDTDTAADQRWMLHAWQPHADYHAALAAERS